MTHIDKYIEYISSVRRYSLRTCEIYRSSLGIFMEFIRSGTGGDDAPGDEDLPDFLTPSMARSYEVYLLEDRGMSPRTVNLHMSVLSGFSRYLLKLGIISCNPAKSVTRPKTEKRLPDFYRRESMEEYFRATEQFAGKDFIYVSPDRKQTRKMYDRRLHRAIVSTLYSTGIRRSELTGLRTGHIDFGRNVAKVVGKGDKMREIPLVDSLSEEISLYLQAVETMVGGDRGPESPLFVTFSGKGLYPAYVDRVIKSELGEVAGITGRKSPHVLRHTLATELLNGGADLNSIKELLGHSSLAATQFYTHNSIAKLKKVYESAHPRASKNGGKNGD
ncbi:MAG: tyrosine-type recombinase/integrase [Bacteroidales bacterium]|nr:tyrosine-type recombinase/integrase [Bacteroidales bacterium]